MLHSEQALQSYAPPGLPRPSVDGLAMTIKKGTMTIKKARSDNLAAFSYQFFSLVTKTEGVEKNVAKYN